MFHLGVCDAGRVPFFFNGKFHWDSIRRHPPDQQLASPRKIGSALQRAQALAGLCRTGRSPISSPLSQNAAALLFDLGPVDIR
jgi:hypothetical protein